jgi:small-conductance mechanosensitive channel
MGGDRPEIPRSATVRVHDDAWLLEIRMPALHALRRLVAGTALLLVAVIPLAADAAAATTAASLANAPAAAVDSQQLASELRSELQQLQQNPTWARASERHSVLASFLSAVEADALRATAADAGIPDAPLPRLSSEARVDTTELDRWRDQRDMLALQADALQGALSSLGEQNQRDNAEIRRHRSEERLWSERARIAPVDSAERAEAEARTYLAYWRARHAEYTWQQGVSARRSAEATLPRLQERLRSIDALVMQAAPRQVLRTAVLKEVLASLAAEVAAAELHVQSLRAPAAGAPNEAILAAELERIVVLRGQRDVWNLLARAVQAMGNPRETAEILRIADEAILQLEDRKRWAQGQLAFADSRGGTGDEVAARRRLLAVLERSQVLLQRTRGDLAAAGGGQPGRAAAIINGIRDAARTVWEWELFALTDRHFVDGREVVQEYGITLGKSLGMLVLVLLGYGIVAVLSRILQHRLLPMAGVERRRARTLTRWTSGLLLLLLVLAVLKLARVPLVAFAFLGGALAIGIGFGAQTMLKNLMSGILLLLERRIRVGDVLTVEGASGRCTDIGLRSTTIAGFDGIELVVPNATLLESTVKNWTGTSPLVRREILFGVPCDGRERELAAVIAACAREVAGIREEPAPKVLAVRFIEGGIELGL